MQFTSIRLAARVPDIYQAQVMQNLARTADNPGSMPYLSRMFNGTASSTDKASGVANLMATARKYTSVTYGLSSIERDVQANIGLAPIDDPDRLVAMQAAYTLVAAPNAANRFAVENCLKRYLLGKDPCVEVIPRGWLHIGSKHDVPHCAAAVANYGKAYVWVMPENLASLTQFTYLILNIATLTTSVNRPATSKETPGPKQGFGGPPGDSFSTPDREPVPFFNSGLLLVPRP